MARETHGYVIATLDEGHPVYYVEGFCVGPTWSALHNANRYSNKQHAIGEARKLANPLRIVTVEPYHRPFGPVKPVWASKRGVK